ncbi:hypothetical protein JOF56_005276 [Kibdelosporangium banguiense]|uniref:CBM6 domain-containing protein n=1 Tax=Kibdelosporangium banguiense TaxID=1365924 RepID=A0ABS4TKI3_9PSEU|nr:hypothetical protein [Kibdelosporangium banguiense]MBP2324891.1 hypothetical protein [Kibdelosporangium banguiense]
MDRRLKRAAFGVAACAAAAVATLLVNQPDQPVGTQIVVPQARYSEADVPKPPQSSVSVPLPSPSIGTVSRTPAPSTSEYRQPVMPSPRPPSPTTPPKPAAVDYQAEDARVYYARFAANHSGFTGSGFIDYDNAQGGAIEWTVTTAAADIVFRFANGSGEARIAAITVNGTVVEYAFFPVTNGWSDWRTLTVHATVPAGTTKIRATAITKTGGPNIDKITLVPPV